MMYMSRKLYFSAMHVYRNESWSDEENRQVFGLCSNPNGHGHDYTLEIMVKGPVHDKSGIIVNIVDIDSVVRDFVLTELDGKHLNIENRYFSNRIPTTENLVQYIWDHLDGVFRDCELFRVRLYEDPTLFAEKEKDAMIRLTRKYHFSTAHRLHSPQMTDEENKALFGKCNNPYGHGHNYYLEVTVAGIPDPVTGMIINLADLDQIVEEHVTVKFDHKNLNLDTEEFKHINPTAENIVLVIWELLAGQLPGLYKLGLYETEKNYFEYYGDHAIS